MLIALNNKKERVAINNGARVVMVAKYLGHTKIDETLNTYSHMFKSKLDDLINIIDNL